MMEWGVAARVVGLGFLAFVLASCAQTQLVVHAAKAVKKSADALASTEEIATLDAEVRGGHYKIGDPYEVKGVRYHPRVQPNYAETGVASWYGKPFHGRRTANGETYDMNELTAAHKTLPMPTMVRVTNLENGRSMVLRVNDRGPFVNGRIIDVSRRSAQLLGFYRPGTAKVKVEIVSARGGFIADAGETSDAERAAVAAVPRGAVTVESLPPPEGVTQAPATAASPPASVRKRPVEPTKMYIQAGAFVEQDNAARLQADLGDLGNVGVSSVVVDGVRFFRVRIGPLETLEAADLSLAQMIDNGFTAARIVVD